jgi:hypothetical protein
VTALSHWRLFGPAALLWALGGACIGANPAFVQGTEDASVAEAGPGAPDTDVGASPDRGAPLVDAGGGTPVDLATELPRLDLSPSDAMTPGPFVDAPLDAPSDAPSPVTQGLLARFAFDQAPPGGTTLSDGLGNSAELEGTVTFADDRPPTASAGRSLAFDGTTTFADVTLAPASQPSSTGAKSVAMWIKATGPGGAKHTIIAMFNRSKAADVGLQIGFGAADVAAWRYGRSFNHMQVTVSRDEWHHVVLTSEVGLYLLYIDGVERARSTTWYDAAKAGILDAVKLGTYDQLIEPSFYKGLLSDLRIYGRTLSPAEIRTLAGLR